MLANSTITPIILLATGMLALAGCKRQAELVEISEPATASRPAKTDSVNIEKKTITGEWTLISIDQQALSGGGNPSLVFGEDGNCWGSTGVNQFKTTADFNQLSNGWLKLGPASVTRMAGPPEAMALEKMFLDRIQAVSSFRLEGNFLHLYTEKDQTVTFERVFR